MSVVPIAIAKHRTGSVRARHSVYAARARAACARGGVR